MIWHEKGNDVGQETISKKRRSRLLKLRDDEDENCETIDRYFIDFEMRSLIFLTDQEPLHFAPSSHLTVAHGILVLRITEWPHPQRYRITSPTNNRWRRQQQQQQQQQQHSSLLFVWQWDINNNEGRVESKSIPERTKYLILNYIE
jgi:hypothetical protein